MKMYGIKSAKKSIMITVPQKILIFFVALANNRVSIIIFSKVLPLELISEACS